MTKLIPGKLYKINSIISAEYEENDVHKNEIVMFLYFIKGNSTIVNRYFFMHKTKIIESREFDCYIEKILDKLV